MIVLYFLPNLELWVALVMEVSRLRNLDSVRQWFLKRFYKATQVQIKYSYLFMSVFCFQKKLSLETYVL